MLKVIKIFEVFLYGFILDGAYVLWTTSVTKDNYLLGGVASIFIALPALLGYFAMFKDKKLIIPYLTGLSTGTMVSMYLF